MGSAAGEREVQLRVDQEKQMALAGDEARRGDETGRALEVPFGERTADRAQVAWLPWLLAGVAVAIVVGVLLMVGHGKRGGPAGSREEDAYGTKLQFSGLQMSESTSLSGGKSTFIDGVVKNGGDEAVTGASMAVLFGNDEALPAQKEQVPLTLIRTREPYVDTEMLDAAPLRPGQQAEFRLIFENIGSNWNQQMPVMRVTQTFVQCSSCR